MIDRKNPLVWAAKELKIFNEQNQGDICVRCGKIIGYWKCLTLVCYLNVFWARKELMLKHLDMDIEEKREKKE